jgi:hypothetical protein
VSDAQTVVQCCFGNEQIGDRRAVPHAVMVSQLALEVEGALEYVGRRRNDLETGMKL